MSSSDPRRGSSSDGRGRRRPGSVLLLLSGALFALLALSILSRRFFGSSALVRDLSPTPTFEFLLLFAIAVTFVGAALARERQARKDGSFDLTREDHRL